MTGCRTKWGFCNLYSSAFVSTAATISWGVPELCIGLGCELGSSRSQLALHLLGCLGQLSVGGALKMMLNDPGILFALALLAQSQWSDPDVVFPG